MRKLKLFENFDKAVNEDMAWYIKEGYIEDASVKTKEDLFALIDDNINKAWETFSKSHDIKFGMEIKKVADGSHRKDSIYLNVAGAPITGKDLGVFEHGMKKASLSLFNGKEVAFAEKDGKFLFKPRIWATLTIAYESLSGGTNGVDYIIDTDPHKSNSIDYHVLDKAWYTDKEYFAKHEN